MAAMSVLRTGREYIMTWLRSEQDESRQAGDADRPEVSFLRENAAVGNSSLLVGRTPRWTRGSWTSDLFAGCLPYDDSRAGERITPALIGRYPSTQAHAIMHSTCATMPCASLGVVFLMQRGHTASVFTRAFACASRRPHMISQSWKTLLSASA